MIVAALILLQAVSADPLAPFDDRAVDARPAAERIIRRGESVTLRLSRGVLTISTPARALGDAPLGGRVRLVVPSTRRTVDAVVEGPGVARLSLP